MLLMITFGFIFVTMLGMVENGVKIETESLESMASGMNQVVPFVMGIYISISLKRWWSLRVEGLGCIFASIQDICMFVGCVMPAPRHTPVRTLIMKWAFASIFLLLKAVRNISGMNDMLYKGLLSAEEIKVLAQVEDIHARPVILW